MASFSSLPVLLPIVYATMCTLIACSGYATAGRAPPPVMLRKCCRNDEHMDTARRCIAGAIDKWMPLVWMLAKNKYYDPFGEAPRHFRIVEETLPATCARPQQFASANNHAILSNGSLYLNERAISVPPDHFCVEKDMVLVCFPGTGNDMDPLMAPQYVSRVRKCCGPGAAYSQPNTTCVVLSQRHQLAATRIINTSSVDVAFGFPECQQNNFAIAGRFDGGHLEVATGAVTLASGKILEADQYCLEHTLDGDDTFVKVFACSEHFPVSPKLSTAGAAAAAGIPQQHIRFTLYSIGLLISVVFLAATLVAGFLVPSNHHVLHWRCQTHYAACLLVGDLLLAITQISGRSITGWLCVTMASSMHFFFLAAFFWLNTMCFNIWWTFRDFRPTSLEKGQELCRLRIYEVYAWGVPLLIAGLAAIIDNLPESPDDTFLRPRFHESGCWFHGDMEILTYFFGPIGILLCINLLLFASTARQLTCGLWKRDDVKSTTERAALGRVCLKLVVVMGVTWVADVLSWAVGGPHSLWYVTDFINALQGVLIFIVVGCQPQVWSAMKRLWSTKTGRNVTNTTHGPQHSSSSHGLPSMGESVTNNTFTNTTSTKMPMETVC